MSTPDDSVDPSDLTDPFERRDHDDADGAVEPAADPPSPDELTDGVAPGEPRSLPVPAVVPTDAADEAPIDAPSDVAPTAENEDENRDEHGGGGGIGRPSAAASIRAAVIALAALAVAAGLIGASGHGRWLVLLGLTIVAVGALVLRRRVVAWYRRPWDEARMIRLAVTTAVLTITTYVTLKIVHAVPGIDDVLFWDRTPAGGDLGAHVWAPAYLRDHLLTHLRIQGWSMDWYAGLPVYRFYMVTPALAITLLDAWPGVPYGVAMKIVAASGIVSLPACCWAFGRLARFRYPMPELFAFAGLAFLLNESYTIYGGNILSTMAGEFSFSIAMSLMMLGLGLLCRALDDGRLPVWAAVFLALAGVTHGIVLIYTAIAAIVIVLCKSGRDLWRVFVEVVNDPDSPPAARSIVYGLLMAPAAVAVGVLISEWAGVSRGLPVGIALAALVSVVVLSAMLGGRVRANRVLYRRFGFAMMIGVLTVALSAFWVGPFLFNHEFMTDMKYGFEPGGGSFSGWREMFLDLHPVFNVLVYGLAIIGFVYSILRRHVYGIAIGATGLIAIGLTFWAQQSLPIIGLLWNPRVLPLLYMMRYLMMMVGIVELGGLLVNILRDHRSRRPLTVGPASGLTVVTGVGVLAVFLFTFQVFPIWGRSEVVTVTEATDDSAAVTRRDYVVGPIRNKDAGRSRADSWTRYNFQGYEQRPAWPEYRELMHTMLDIAEEHGCGRALWEIDNRSVANDGYEGHGRYGTTMALMLLPFWTDGCIASSEGLYFEASGTTPYHFLTAAAASRRASNPVRQLRYTNNDGELAVDLLRELGVNYYLATTEEAIAQAELQPELTLVGASGRRDDNPDESAYDTKWRIYQVADSELVVPLTTQPVVVNGRVGDQRECWLEVGTSWFLDQDAWPAVPAAGGPDDWQRIDVAIDAERLDPPEQPAGPECGDPHFGEHGRGRRVNIVTPGTEIEPVELPAIEVSNVVAGEESVSFDVSDTGVPVLVRVSYFPNWEVSGADGPYRIAPNFMVVVPTDDHVELRYNAYSTKDKAFYGLTALGLIAGVVISRRKRFDFGEPDETPGGPDPEAPPAPGPRDAIFPSPPWSPATPVVTVTTTVVASEPRERYRTPRSGIVDGDADVVDATPVHGTERSWIHADGELADAGPDSGGPDADPFQHWVDDDSPADEHSTDDSDSDGR